MYCVLWTYKVPPELSEQVIRKQFLAVADRYLGVPGLVRKYFGFTEDAKSVIGIYLWSSREAADAFYTPSWMAGVTERWGAAPVRTEWTVPVVAESMAGRIVSDPIASPPAPPADPASVVRDVFQRLFQTGVAALDGHPGMEALRTAYPLIKTAFPDAAVELQQQLVDGDRVASHWIVTGTHLGDFFGIAPTGKAVKYQNIGIATVIDGKITQYNAENGWLAMLRQIDALPLHK